jgi:hypothetical protein
MANEVSGVSENLVQTMPPAYFYSLWLKHLVFRNAANYDKAPYVPRTVAEIGPGSSIGLGLSAVLSGCQRYYGFDLVSHIDPTDNLALFDELVEMFRSRQRSTNSGGFPNYAAYLDKNRFPSAILTEERLAASLAPRRLEAIRALLRGEAADPEFGLSIKYVTPWTQAHHGLRGKVELIISHSTMEHVDDLSQAYGIFSELNPIGGWMSHQIDFRAHGFTEAWNGYLKIDDDEWRRLVATQPYGINRQPGSVHARLIRENGYEIVNLLCRLRKSHVKREELAARFKQLSEFDLRCMSMFVQAFKI